MSEKTLNSEMLDLISFLLGELEITNPINEPKKWDSTVAEILAARTVIFSARQREKEKGIEEEMVKAFGGQTK